MVARTIESHPIATSEHVVQVRQAVRQRAVELGFSLVDQTKIVTAASELARNTLMHGGGGQATIEVVVDGVRRGLRLGFEDDGPGIADVAQAMKDGFSPRAAWASVFPGQNGSPMSFRFPPRRAWAPGFSSLAGNDLPLVGPCPGLESAGVRSLRGARARRACRV